MFEVTEFLMSRKAEMTLNNELILWSEIQFCVLIREQFSTEKSGMSDSIFWISVEFNECVFTTIK